jgi:hypothetical protein
MKFMHKTPRPRFSSVKDTQDTLTKKLEVVYTGGTEAATARV